MNSGTVGAHRTCGSNRARSRCRMWSHSASCAPPTNGVWSRNRIRFTNGRARTQGVARPALEWRAGSLVTRGVLPARYCRWLRASSRKDSMTGSKLLIRNTAFNLAGQGVPLIAALVAIPWLIHGLGADRFGVLTLAWAAIGYFSLVDLGLGRALTHAVATRLGSDREDELVSIGWTALLLMLLLGAVGAAALAAATPWIVNDALKIPRGLVAESSRSFYLLAASLPMVVSTAGFRGIIEAHQHFGLATMLRTPLAVLSYLGPLLALPFTNRLDIVVGVLVVGRFLMWAAHFGACIRRYPFLRHRVAIRADVVMPLLRVGGWMTVSNVVTPIMAYLDRFFIGALLPVAAVAYYVTPSEAVTKL